MYSAYLNNPYSVSLRKFRSIQRILFWTVFFFMTGFAIVPAVTARTLTAGVFVATGDSVRAADAVVSVFALPDTLLVDAAPTGPDGYVSFDVSPETAYRVRALSLVYGNAESDIKESQDSVRLCYEDRYEQLEELVVNSRKPYFSREAGKFIFDPSMYWSHSVDGVSLLKKTPLVTVEDDKVSIFGRGESKIYINGRDPKMSPEQIMIKLRSLPPEYIKKIELITNAGSAESSSYNGGIVNVIVDDPTQGFSGMATASLMYAYNYLRPQFGVVGSLSKGVFNSTLMIDYRHSGSNYKSEQEYFFKQSGITDRIDGRYKSASNMITARYDMEFLLGKTKIGAYVGIEGSGGDFNSYMTESTTVDSSDTHAEEEITSSSSILQKSPFMINVWRGGAYSTTPIGTNGSCLDISADVKNYSTYKTFDYRMSDSKNSESNGLDVFSVDVKADYKAVFKDLSQLSLGYEYYHSDAGYRTETNLEDSRFRTRDHLHSFYASYRRTWNAVVSTEVGVRLEEYLRYADGADRYTLFSALPSASVTFNIPRGAQSISLGYNRKTNFPHFIYLNPAVVWSSPVSCSYGNPDLDPGFVDDFSLYYSFLKDFTFTANYIYFSGGHQEVQWYENDTAVSTYANRGSADFLYLGLDYTRHLGNNVRMSLTGSVSRSKHNLSFSGASLDGQSWGTTLTTAWMFFISQKHQWYANLRVSVSSPTKAVTRYDSEWYVSTDVQIQKGLGKWGSLTLLFSPWNSNTDQYYDSDDYYYRNKMISPYQYVSLSFNAMFGKGRVRGASQKSNAKLESR